MNYKLQIIDSELKIASEKLNKVLNVIKIATKSTNKRPKRRGGKPV